MANELMRFRIHFEHSDGTPDDFVVVNSDLESIRNQADTQLRKRGVDVNTAWSEELEG